MIIDLHAHYLSPAIANELRRRPAAPRIVQVDGESENYYMPDGVLPFSDAYTDIANRVRFLDDAGIDIQVLSLPGLFGIDYLPVEESAPLVRRFNDDLSLVCESHPSRFLGLAALPLADVDESVTELMRAVETLGMIGAILPVNAFLSADHADRLVPIFEYADSRKLHVFIHPGWRPDEYPVTRTTANERLELVIPRRALHTQHNLSMALVTLLHSGFLDAYPGTTVHVANLGGTFPMVVERMDHTIAARFPDTPLPSTGCRRIHVDCSSLGPLAIGMAAKVYGAERILVGTDTPIFNASRTLDAVRSAALTDTERSRIFSGNATRLLGRWIGGIPSPNEGSSSDRKRASARATHE